MDSPIKESHSSSRVLESDDDVYHYLKDRFRSESESFGQGPLYEYVEKRDFQVEPLEVKTAALLVNTTKPDMAAKPVGERVIRCWVPASNDDIRSLKSSLSNWGYEVVTAERTNRSSNMVPRLAFTARQSPSPLAQLKALGAADPIPDELLDGWVAVVRNRHAADVDALDVDEWGDIRGVESDEIRENLAEMHERLDEIGGLPGTQWSIRENGGVPITDD